MRRLTVLIAVALALAACGGDSDEPDESSDEPSTQATSADAPSEGEPSSDGTRVLVVGQAGVDIVDLEAESQEQFIAGVEQVSNLRLIDGTLWFVDGADLVAADASSGDVVGRVTMADSVVDLAVAGNTAWVLTGIPGASTEVAVIDTETMEQVGSIEAPEPTTYLYIAALADDAWVFGGDVELSTAASKLDATSFAQSTTADTGLIADSMAAGEGGIWIGGTIPAFESDSGNPESGIVEIDPVTGDVITTIALGEPADHIVVALGFDHVWATEGLDGTLSKIDPASGEIVDSTDTGDGAAGVPLEISFTEDSVWVFNSSASTMSSYDPDTLEFEDGINVPTFSAAPIFAP